MIKNFKNLTFIRVPLDHGYAEFECRQVGSLDLAERLKRQERLWTSCRVVDHHHDNQLSTALRAGNGVLAGAVLSRYPNKVALDIGDDALDWIARLFDSYHDAQALRYDPDHAETLDGYQHLILPAAIIGEVAFTKDVDTISVLHITDADVVGGRTWTPTDGESQVLKNWTSTAAGRIDIAHKAISSGGVPLAVFWGHTYD